MEDSRTTLSRTSRQSSLTMSRASVRELDDKHLMQQIKQADVMHSETPSDFERWQMVGLTSVPLKQEDDKQQQKSSSSGGGDEQGDWNHDQPKGKSSEALILYLNGSRSHPVGIVDDRRVRPYNLKAGDTSLYAASGTGQMVLHTDDGTYIVALDNKPEQAEEGSEEKERVVSLRHVKKDKQSREIKKGQEVEDHVHEGKPDQVNTEVRASAKKIEILDGESVIAVYNKEDKSWTFSNFKKLNLNPEDEFNVTTKKIVMTATSDKFDINGKPINLNGGGPTVPPFTVPG